MGLQTGVDPFTGGSIVPQREEGLPPEQQFGRETSQTAIQLGRLFKVSPRLIDFALQDIAAGAGQSVNWLLSAGLEALGVDTEVFGSQDPDAKPPPEGLERMTREKVPGVARFIGTRGTQLERRGYDNLADAVIDTNRVLNEMPELRRLGIKFGQVGSVIGKMELTPKQRAQYQETAGRLAIERIERLLAIPTFVSQSDKRKEKLLRAAMDDAREEARKRVERGVRAPIQPARPTRRPSGQRRKVFAD